jgi:hypothetical protein
VAKRVYHKIKWFTSWLPESREEADRSERAGNKINSSKACPL